MVNDVTLLRARKGAEVIRFLREMTLLKALHHKTLAKEFQIG